VWRGSASQNSEALAPAGTTNLVSSTPTGLPCFVRIFPCIPAQPREPHQASRLTMLLISRTRMMRKAVADFTSLQAGSIALFDILGQTVEGCGPQSRASPNCIRKLQASLAIPCHATGCTSPRLHFPNPTLLPKRVSEAESHQEMARRVRFACFSLAPLPQLSIAARGWDQ
jgi:hypothetical protein